jgi:large subunit ribosomal protein L6
MITKFFNQSIIKVPKFITCYFCQDRNFLLLKGKLGFKLIKLEVIIFLDVKKNIIIITNECVGGNFNTKENKRGLVSRTKTLIKKGFLDVTRKSYKKLKVVGVGFKVSCLEFKSLKLLKLELGYSHSVYFRIPSDILVLINSPTKFIVSGISSDRVGAVSSRIRKLKLPESYKGKGILYENEEVVLKEIRK